ncbi:MAG: YdeI/OmpD-associated family protein [Spirochaetes bacterium]|nr:YdeI/OmpD-associated family protein [Spirochaetota bacterium]
MNPKVDAYIRNLKKWQEELKKLRTIVRGCPLTEELKWGVPCYTYQNSNVVLLHVFKEYCAILFIKGSLLKDSKGVLIQQTANVQAGRQIRFTDVKGIESIEDTLNAYILEAIEIEKAGLKVDLKKTAEFNMPEEFKNKLDKNKALKAAFNALTPGRQRAYILYFSSAKQSQTREARIEKYTAQILKGKGLDD